MLFLFSSTGINVLLFRLQGVDFVLQVGEAPFNRSYLLLRKVAFDELRGEHGVAFVEASQFSTYSLNFVFTLSSSSTSTPASSSSTSPFPWVFSINAFSIRREGKLEGASRMRESIDDWLVFDERHRNLQGRFGKSNGVLELAVSRKEHPVILVIKIGQLDGGVGSQTEQSTDRFYEFGVGDFSKDEAAEFVVALDFNVYVVDLLHVCKEFIL